MHLRFNSIMSRIVLLHAIAVIATAVLMPLALHWYLNSNVEALQRRAMLEQARTLTRHLTSKPDGDWSLDLPAGLRDLYSEAYGRYSYAILDNAGNVLFSSHNDRRLIFPADDRQAATKFQTSKQGDRVISGVSFSATLSDRTVLVQVAEDLSHRDVIIDDIVANFFWGVVWVTLPILIVLLGINILIFGRAVQPLLQASDRADHIGPTRIDVRLPTDDIPAEIRPLVIAVNRALDRLERGYEKLREFAADAAHELRTPLTILRTRIETLPDRAVAQALLHDVEGMTRIVSQLLDAAELETFVIGQDEIADLRRVCAEVAELLAPLALMREKAIALSGCGSSVWVKGNEEMLRRAVRNLAENALRHAPKKSEIEIVVEADASVSVLDRGEGVAAENRKLIFQRFWRSDARSVEGAGLGLSIVKRIVELHSGTITVDNRAGGGAEFRLTFNLAEQAANVERLDAQKTRVRH